MNSIFYKFIVKKIIIIMKIIAGFQQPGFRMDVVRRSFCDNVNLSD